MLQTDIMPINFAISDIAKIEIQRMMDHENNIKTQSALVFYMAWGKYKLNNGSIFEDIIFGFYGKGNYSSVADMIQSVSGMDIVFFVVPRDHHNFAGKILDYIPEKGLFLREPLNAAEAPPLVQSSSVLPQRSRSRPAGANDNA
jgi:hypothetical protein